MLLVVQVCWPNHTFGNTVNLSQPKEETSSALKPLQLLDPDGRQISIQRLMVYSAETALKAYKAEAKVTARFEFGFDVDTELESSYVANVSQNSMLYNVTGAFTETQ